MQTTRREFLSYCGTGGLAAVSFGGVVPRMLAAAADESRKAAKNDHVLVVVELNGGNDGLNTIIPFENGLYYKNRRTIAVPKDQVVKLNEQLGLHPALAPLAELHKEGQLVTVLGVGYPDPDRSHFRSMEIWHTGSTAKLPPTSGWLGKILDEEAGEAPAPRNLGGLSLTGSQVQAFQADKVVVPVLASLDSLTATEQGSPEELALRRRLVTVSGRAPGQIAFLRQESAAAYRTAEKIKAAAEKYKSSIEYPPGGLGPQMQRAAQLIAADLGVRVLFASQGGYDTHSGQADAHTALLTELAESLAAFQKDLANLGQADKVTVLVFSEFGRRVDENASLGTDHGAASNLFLVGARVKGGIVGDYPSLEKLGDGDLIFHTDFRQVYTSLLDDWLGCPAKKTLGGEFSKLDVMRA